MASNGYITTSTNTYLCVDVCSWLPMGMGMAISKNTCFPFLRGQHLCGNEELLVAVCWSSAADRYSHPQWLVMT